LYGPWTLRYVYLNSVEAVGCKFTILESFTNVEALHLTTNLRHLNIDLPRTLPSSSTYVPSNLIKILSPISLRHSLKALTITFFDAIINPTDSNWTQLIDQLLGFKQLRLITIKGGIVGDGFQDVFAPFASRGAFLFSATTVSIKYDR
jgi:hypothetical protein